MSQVSVEQIVELLEWLHEQDCVGSVILYGAGTDTRGEDLSLEELRRVAGRVPMKPISRVEVALCPPFLFGVVVVTLDIVQDYVVEISPIRTHRGMVIGAEVVMLSVLQQ